MSQSLSIYDKGAPRPCPAPFNLAAHVLARAPELSEKSALQILRPQGAERWSYGKLEAAVRGTGTGLQNLGLPQGARILMRLGNSVDFPVLYLGAIAAGYVPIPTSAQLTQTEVEAIAAEIRPDLIVAAPDVALPAAPDCPILTSQDLLAFRELPPCDYVMGDPDRLAYMIYTSGTSGRARAVMHAHRAIWARQMMMQDWYGLRESDRLLHAGAFNWTYTLGTGLMDPWTMGATALIPAEGVQASQLPLLLKRFDATIFAAAPGVYRQMLRGPIVPLPKLRHGLSAGERLPDAVRDAWHQATKTPIFEAYGMSECSTPVSGSPDRPAPEGATGYPQTGRRLAVVSPEGLALPFDTPGILAIHDSDPGLFLGYLNQPEETAARFHGPWFLTGDSVVMKDDFAIHYLGREDDMMNAGGFRVSPLEVEAAMNQHPAILESAAVEVQIKADTSVIALFYTGEATPPEELATFAAQALARYKQPRLYIPLATLPKGANNKLARRLLRETWQPSAGDPQ